MSPLHPRAFEYENMLITPTTLKGLSLMNKNKIKLTKEMINLVKEECGTKMCKDYNPNCTNCQGQVLLGHLYDFLDSFEYENTKTTV